MRGVGRMVERFVEGDAATVNRRGVTGSVTTSVWSRVCKGLLLLFISYISSTGSFPSDWPH